MKRNKFIRIVQDPMTPPNDKNFAFRMLAQASRVSPDASQALVDMAWSKQIKGSDFIRIASTLEGREYRLYDKFDKGFNPDLAVEIVMRRRRSFTGKERRRFWLKEYWNISMSKSF